MCLSVDARICWLGIAVFYYVIESFSSSISVRNLVNFSIRAVWTVRFELRLSILSSPIWTRVWKLDNNRANLHWDVLFLKKYFLGECECLPYTGFGSFHRHSCTTCSESNKNKLISYSITFETYSFQCRRDMTAQWVWLYWTAFVDLVQIEKTKQVSFHMIECVFLFLQTHLFHH